MLKQLTIKNFALIDHISIDFGDYFNVLTGETGAGKSLIVEAVGLLSGQRGSADFIREGCDKSFIEGYFELNNDKIINELTDLGLDVTDGLVLSRELAKNGKNSCRINGRLVPLSFYGEVGNKLIDVHGQSQELALLSPVKQMELLDSFAGEELLSVKNKVLFLYTEIRKLKKKIDDYQLFTENRAAKLDFLDHQIRELENASLKVGEEEELQQEQKILSNYEKLVVGCNTAYNYLLRGEREGYSAYDIINYALTELEKLKDLDPKINSTVEGLRTIVYQLEEYAREIRFYADNKEYDPYRLEKIEERLNEIRTLKRKYGLSVEELITKLSELKEEHAKLEESSKNLDSYEKDLTELETQIKAECAILHTLRLDAAGKLERQINLVLEELNLPEAKFTIHVEEKEGYEADGFDRIEFYFCPNKGESPKPLAKVASGGEISRVMLAFKSVLNQYANVPTIIFDEIDTGVSGETIINLSKTISKLAKTSQVICVTHSPALASFADTHFLIFKKLESTRTITKVLKLGYEERIKELSRMLGGAEHIDTAAKHAKEMLKFALNEKCV